MKQIFSNVPAMMVTICLFFAAGCGQNESDKAPAPAPGDDATSAAQETAPQESAPDKVVVYSARKQHLIQPLFDQFTADTGIEVEYTTDSAQPLIARIDAAGDNPQADVFMAVDAGSLWFAAQEGILQPVTSDVLEERVPALLQDEENRWFGLSKRARTIVYSTERVQPDELSTYADLAKPEFKDRLCLRTSQKVYNQSLVAMLIKEHGEAKVAEILQGWVANLAAPVFSSDSLLIQAIAAGQCDVGIVNTYYLAEELKKTENLPVKVFWADQNEDGVHMNISGAGVIKNAPHKEAAVALLEWLVSDKAQQKFAGLNYEFPVVSNVAVDPLVAAWGEFEESKTAIQNAGEYQAQAVMLMDKAGYK